MAPPSLGALLARPASELSRSGEHGQKYLLGGYSVAEAYQLTVLSWSKFAKVALEPFPNVRSWQDRVAARPAVQQALRRHV